MTMTTISTAMERTPSELGGANCIGWVRALAPGAAARLVSRRPAAGSQGEGRRQRGALEHVGAELRA